MTGWCWISCNESLKLRMIINVKGKNNNGKMYDDEDE